MTGYRGTPASSQIIWLHERLADLEDKNHALQAENKRLNEEIKLLESKLQEIHTIVNEVVS